MRLNPSMRENFRYLLLRITPPQFSPDPKALYYAISDATALMFGDCHAARIWPSVLSIEDNFAIIRCRRGTEDQAMAAIAAVTQIDGVHAALHPVRTSGTVITLRERIRSARQPEPHPRAGTVTIRGEILQGILQGTGCIDFKEKGINLNIPQYITEEDIEDLNHDE